MIKVENIETWGWEAAIRGMRNPLNSWSKSDSTPTFLAEDSQYHLGPNDLGLALRLIKAGTEHRKFLRMIHVQMDIAAPLYWWKEFDTYKVGTTANSCSTMHKITSKPIELTDFSIDDFCIGDTGIDLNDMFINVVAGCEDLRQRFLDTKDKKYWKGLIQLLPTSYNQKRTWDGSLETVLSILHQRNHHKLDEWETFRQAMFDHIPYCKEFYNAMFDKEAK